MASTPNPVVATALAANPAAPKAAKTPSKPAVKADVKPASKTVNKTASMPVAKPTAKAAAKPVVKTAPKPTTKPVAQQPSQPAAPAAPKAQAAVAAKKPAAGPAVKKQAPKIVRDSFTMTSQDHDLIKAFKRDAIAAGRDQTKKSEVVRAALHCFAALSAAQRASVIDKLAPVKTGRPAKGD